MQSRAGCGITICEVMSMKLATALAERHDLQHRLTELRQRLEQNARVQEGDTPAEEPAALLQ